MRRNFYNKNMAGPYLPFDLVVDMKNNMPKTDPHGVRNDETSIRLNEEPSTERRKNNKAVYNPKGSPCKYKFRFAHITNTIVALIVLLFIGLVELGLIPHKGQGFFCKDPSLSYAYTGDTITPVSLVVVTTVLPLVIFIFVEYTRPDADIKNTKYLIWRWMKAFLIGISVTLLITEVCKIVAGEPRPHFLDTCRPDAATTCTPGIFVPTYECTNKNVPKFLVLDSSRSFPSGHSSCSLFVGVFLAAFIQYRFKPSQMGSLLKPFLISCVLLWGFCCALSRIIDHRHHWWDALAGSVLGVFGALYTVVVFCSRFRLTSTKPTLECASTTALCDHQNRDATSVMI